MVYTSFNVVRANTLGFLIGVMGEDPDALLDVASVLIFIIAALEGVGQTFMDDLIVADRLL